MNSTSEWLIRIGRDSYKSPGGGAVRQLTHRVTQSDVNLVHSASVSTQKHKQTHTNTHTRIHTHIHTQIHTFRCEFSAQCVCRESQWTNGMALPLCSLSRIVLYSSLVCRREQERGHWPRNEVCICFSFLSTHPLAKPNQACYLCMPLLG